LQQRFLVVLIIFGSLLALGFSTLELHQGLQYHMFLILLDRLVWSMLLNSRIGVVGT
ncbi:hypothetical protein T12_13760, partial [Trichinella patagoniensis]